MKVYRYIFTSLLTVLLIGWSCLLTGCTDHPEIEQPYTDESEGRPLRVVGMTRSGDETSVQDPMKGQSVQLFLDDGKTNPIPSDAVIYQGKMASNNDLFGNKTSLKVKPGANYHVFGFLPSNANGTNGNSSVTVDSETQTATMTIENLASLSTDDVCVVIGVKGKENEEMKPGVFDYHAPEDTEEGYGVSLLVDHLYCAAELKFLVDEGYAALRTIKLHKVTLKTTRNKKLNATVSLTMNETGDNPIFTDPEYADSDKSQEEEIVLYQSTNADGDELSATTPLLITGYFAPGYGTDLKIESKYVVYDKKDSDNPLPSPEDTEEHKFRYAVNDLKTVCTGMTRGLKKTVNMKIIPTYLYILSDNDLDNPTIVLESE